MFKRRAFGIGSSLALFFDCLLILDYLELGRYPLAADVFLTGTTVELFCDIFASEIMELLMLLVLRILNPLEGFVAILLSPIFELETEPSSSLSLI